MLNTGIDEGGNVRMLKKFEVENFKGFAQRFTLDLSAREYTFNKHLVQNEIVNEALIYGKNGIGKSSLGIAIFDIISHLTDKEPIPPFYVTNYLNLNHVDQPAFFRYTFQFDDDTIEYSYEKKGSNELLSEKLILNGRCVIDYNYFDSTNQFIAEDLVGSLNIELVDNRLSVVKYIYRNTPTNSIPLITKMLQFCENMLWYRSLSDGNSYCGFTNGGSNLVQRLYEKGAVHDFENFLRENGLDYELGFESFNGVPELFAYFHHGESKARFVTIASTGTMALFLFYIWKITAFDSVSFLFIDEFDAFLHYEASERLVLELGKLKRFQTMLTTHNTNLMNNTITRPDCCYIITDHGITNLVNATSRELREGHNLEKLYKSGEFHG